MVSLGCAKNLVDAEVMLGILAREGLEITNDASLADVVIVNTCSFIDSAQEESVDAILESAQLRQIRNRGQGLIVSGCLPQRFQKELPKLLPEVDAFMGLDQVPQVAQIVRQTIAIRAERLQKEAGESKSSRAEVTARLAELSKLLPPEEAGPAKKPARETSEGNPLVNISPKSVYVPDYTTPRFRLTPRHFAYVKIAEGCNHPCSFCIIPRIRGGHRSRPQSDIVEEARSLIASGVRELNLISQDTTYYGLDLRAARTGSIAAPGKFAAATRALPAGSTTLTSLIRELNTLPGDFWIRLLYTHPAHWTDDLIHAIAECPKVAKYVDMPLQHIHPVMLERMRRETTREYIEDLIRRIRAGIPGIALRTTFIVGFPGETAEYFESLLDFMRSVRFERLGIFAYSKEDGTRAAAMSGQVSDAVKKHRRQEAMSVQLKISREMAAQQMGHIRRVLIEEEATAKELRNAEVSSLEHGMVRGKDRHTSDLHGKFLIARGDADAPDIDGRIYVRGHLPKGEFAQVRIIGHTDYDLIAEPS